VEQDPFRALVTFDMRRFGALAGERFGDGVGDGASLARVGARADDEIVGESGGLAQVEDHHVDRFLVFGGTNREFDLTRQPCRLAAFFSLCHATCLPPGPAAGPSHVVPDCSMCCCTLTSTWPAIGRPWLRSSRIAVDDTSAVDASIKMIDGVSSVSGPTAGLVISRARCGIWTGSDWTGCSG